MATTGNSNVNAKLVLLGDMCTRKSSLIIRFVRGQFLEFQESTIGAAFFARTLSVGDTTVKFEIWDTAGQERYHSLPSIEESFLTAKKWVEELQKQGNQNMVTALAGNKCDLEDGRKVETEEACKYAEENGLFFSETSAKTAINVNDIFVEIARRLPKVQPAQQSAGVVLETGRAEKPQTSSCCS